MVFLLLFCMRLGSCIFFSDDGAPAGEEGWEEKQRDRH